MCTVFIRLWRNNFLTHVINTRYRTSLTDSQNGFRALRAGKITLLRLTENKHSIELEMVLPAVADDRAYRSRRR
jgi:hypothetical protein